MRSTTWRRASTVLALLGGALLTSGAVAGAQEAFTIQGTVVDAATEQPLPNVSVVLRDTEIGTLTDDSGRYTLLARVPPGTYTMQFSLIGRGEQTRPVTLGAERSVALEPVGLQASAVQLEEIVITGTGVSSERQAVGNTVASVTGQEINEAPAATAIDQALQGKITGAVITQNNGQPGGGVSIRLRGTSTILGGAEPLIVVDGVIVENNSGALVGLGANASYSGSALANRLSDIAPSDIERIEVLKGAAAAALYGSRANNGVIQIFTKDGQQGAPVISFRTEFSSSQAPERFNLLEVPRAGPGDVQYVDPSLEIGDPIERYLYQDELFRTGYSTNNQLSISGGNEGTTYYLSGNWNNNNGILEGTQFARVGGRVKVTQRLTDWLDVGANVNYLQTETNFLPEGEQTQGVLTTLIFTPTSYDPSFDPDLGRYPYSPVVGTNPFDVIENWEASSNVERFLGSLEANVRPAPDLRLTWLFGIDDSREEFTYLQPAFATGAGFEGSLQNPVRSVLRYNNDLVLNHEAELGEAYGLNSTAGFRYTFDRNDVIRAAALGLNPGQGTIGAGGATPAASQSISEIATAAGFIQEQLSVGDRLFLTGGVNVEASSAFGEDQRWQFFPRASASYVVDREGWWEASPFGDALSTLRLRAAYGETGGQPPEAYFRFNNYVNVAQAGRPGLQPSVTAGNPELKPERQREWEGGFEAGLFADRVGLEFTYYDQRTEDLVLSVPLQPSSGYDNQYRNIGEVSNKGIEITLNTVNVQRPGFNWSSRLSFARNRNRVEDLGGAADSVNYAYLNYVIEGEPIGIFVGAYYPRDAQGDIILSEGIPRRARACCNEVGDSVVLRRELGNPNPDFTASFSNTLQFGDGLELNFLLDGRFGNEVANFSRRISEYFGAGAAVERSITGEVPEDYYFLNLERHLLYEEFVEDGSFVKLREIALRYRLNPDWVRGLGIGTADITLAGRNLYTWTDYSGIDPEINLFSANTVARGVDFATTPIPRTFALGLNFTF